MFTGIITSVGTVAEVQVLGKARRVRLATSLDISGWKLGCSVACAGVCLTMVEKGSDTFTVELSPETLACTTLGAWQAGTKVNLEPALKLGDELGGHIVTGHVDGVGKVTGIRETAGGHSEYSMEAPGELLPLIAAKGSITVDGVSLTVNRLENNDFSVNLIPHTLNATTLGNLKEGHVVNLEADMLARYVQNMLKSR